MGYQTDIVPADRFGQTSGVANSYLLVLTPPLSAYTTGLQVEVKFHLPNAPGATIDVDGLGPIPLQKESGGILVPLDAADLNTDKIYTLLFDGNAFQVPIPSSGIAVAHASEILSGIARIATQAEVNNGLANDLIVSPQKLAIAQQGKENTLGNPVSDGAVLQSSASGQRAWINVDKSLFTNVFTSFIGPLTFEATMGEPYVLPAGTLRDGELIQIQINGLLQTAPDKTLRVRMGDEILFEHTLSETGIFSIDIIAGRQNTNVMTGKAILLVNGEPPVVKKVQPLGLDLDAVDHYIQFTGQNSVSTPGSIVSHCFIIRHLV